MRLLAVPDWPVGAAFEDRIDMACHLNGIDRRSFLARTGLLVDGHVSAGWGRWLDTKVAGRVADVFEVNVDVVESGLLGSFAGICIPDGSATKAPKDLIRDGWVFISGTRICPECWAETKTEQVRDRLPWSFACTRHQVLLADTCNRCDRRFRAGADSDRAGPRILSTHPRPGRCCNQPARDTTISGLGSTPCDEPYDANPTIEASAQIVDTQTVIDRALDGYPPAVLGDPVTSLQFFTDMRSIGALLARTGPDRETTRPYFRPPASAFDMGTITTTALDVLRCPSVDTAARRLLPAVEAHFDAYNSTTLALLGRTRPTSRTRPILDATLAMIGRPSTRIRRSIQPSLPLDGLNVDQVSVASVAAVLDCFEPVTRQLGELRVDLAVTAAAMDLARIAGMPSYPASGIHLRFENPERAARQAQYVRARIRDAGLLDDWIRACRRAIDRLGSGAKPEGGSA